VAFGFTKALGNIMVGMLSDRFGRRASHVVGWGFGLVLGIVLITADSWAELVVADVFLGAQQGFTWTSNIFMFMDILGPRHRAFASGISNATGYFASAIANYIAGALMVAYGNYSCFYVVLGTCAVGGLLATCLLKDTSRFVRLEAGSAVGGGGGGGGGGDYSMGVTGTPVAAQGEGGGGGLDGGGEGGVDVAGGRGSPGPVPVILRTLRNKSTRVLCWAGLVTNLITGAYTDTLGNLFENRL
jgi:MFS family permease